MIKLSDATYNNIMDLVLYAKMHNKLLELRNKFGVLIAVGTSIKAFTELKDKKGFPVYNVKKLDVLQYDSIKTTITYDCMIDIYSEKNFTSSNPKLQSVLTNSENYWKDLASQWEKSNSPYKEYPDVIINIIKREKNV